MGKTTVHLDYLRYTVPWHDTLNELNNLYHAVGNGELFQFTGELFNPGQGYTEGMRMICGSVMWHKTRPSQGIGVVLTGADLEMVRGAGLDEKELLEFVAAVGGHCTTIHGCINVHDRGADVSELIAQHEDGKLQTSARNIGVYSSKKKINGSWQVGDTLYVGSAKSERQIRVYNKAAERGIDGDWVRLEIVWRGPYAKAAHIAMIDGSIASVIRAGIGGQMETDIVWFREALGGAVDPPFLVPRKQSARAKWLIEIVLPALASEVEDQRTRGEYELRDKFLSVLTGED